MTSRSLLLTSLSLPMTLVLAGACGGQIAALDDGGIGTDGSTTFDSGPEFDGGPSRFDGSPFPTTDAGPVPTPATGAGYILVQEGSTGPTTSVDAVFSTSLSTTCALAQPRGSCIIANCGDPSTLPGLSAGTITLDPGGSSGSATLTPQSDSLGVHYTSWQQQNAVWPIDVGLSILSTGETVPPINTTFAIPRSISVAQPSLGTNNSTVVDSTQDMKVAWSGGGPVDEVLVYLVDTSQPNQQAPDIALCFFPGAPSAAVVPRAILSQARSASASSSFLVAVWPVSRKPLSIGGFDVGIVTIGQGAVGQVQLR